MTNIYKPNLTKIAEITDEAPGIQTFKLNFVDERDEILKQCRRFVHEECHGNPCNPEQFL